MDLDTARAELEQVLRETESTAKVLEGELADESAPDGTLDEHPADGGSEIEEADREHALIEANEARREEAVAALARLDDGTYGRCVVCGEPIPDARLEFRPEAARCLADQEAYEAASA